MKNIVLVFASFFGATAVILGAFGAHAFKKLISADKLSSFDVGVRYQMYHAIVLLIVGFYFQFSNNVEKLAAISFIIGVLLFSVSIYFLSFSEYWGVNLKWLGPITPLGGLFFIIGWLSIFYFFIKNDHI